MEEEEAKDAGLRPSYLVSSHASPAFFAFHFVVSGRAPELVLHKTALVHLKLHGHKHNLTHWYGMVHLYTQQYFGTVHLYTHSTIFR